MTKGKKHSAASKRKISKTMRRIKKKGPYIEGIAALRAKRRGWTRHQRQQFKATLAAKRRELAAAGLNPTDYADGRERDAWATLKRQNDAGLSLVETKAPPLPDSIINAVEFGFRCAEKGMNLEATIEAAFNVVHEKMQSLMIMKSAK